MTRCAVAKLVDGHFEGRIHPTQELTLRAHLPACERCRRYYERRLLLAELDPTTVPAVERLARGLGLSGSRAAPRAAVWLTVAVAAASCALLFLRASAPGAEFQARGTTAGPRIWAYRISEGEKAVELGAAMRARDELAFAYDNPASAERLLVFGVDEHRHVYWYHPGWATAASPPSALAISSGRHELPEAVTHELDGAVLTLYAVFTSESVTVREVEASLDKYTASAAWTQRVRVSP